MCVEARDMDGDRKQRKYKQQRAETGFGRFRENGKRNYGSGRDDITCRVNLHSPDTSNQFQSQRSFYLIKLFSFLFD